MILTHSSHYSISPLVCHNKNTFAYKVPLQSAVTSVPGHCPLGERLAGGGRAGAAVPTSEMKPNPLSSITGCMYFLLSFCKIQVTKKQITLLLNSVGNDPKERGPGTRDGRKMRTESSRSKHVREEKSNHAQNLCMEPKVVRSWRTSVRGRGMSRWKVWK